MSKGFFRRNAQRHATVPGLTVRWRTRRACSQRPRTRAAPKGSPPNLGRFRCGWPPWVQRVGGAPWVQGEITFFNKVGPSTDHLISSNLVGGWPTSEKYDFVSWDHYSQYMEKNVPNHQPACVKFRKAKKESDYWELSMLYKQLCKWLIFRNTMSAACNWWLTCHEYLRNSMKFCNWVEKVAWHHQV